MRAREFINESDGLRGKSRAAPNHEFEKAHPGIVAPAGRGDLYIGRYYDFYRVSQLTGMDPEDLKNLDEISFFGNLPVYSSYSDADREKLIRVMKKLGMKPEQYIGPGSEEMDDTNCTSPVKAFKGFE